MAMWQDAFLDWTHAWASLQDLDFGSSGELAAIGNTHVLIWSSAVNTPQAASSSDLILVTEDPDGATAFAATLGLQSSNRQLLLRAETEDLDLIPNLPPDAYLAEAPMDNYDLVEVALFDRPVARGRLSMRGELGVLAEFDVDPGHEDLVSDFEQAMVAGLGEEAFTHGADTLFLIASVEQAERFSSVDGWSQVAEILTFVK